MRVFTSNDFTGQYPVGAALVVVATNEDEALSLAKNCCEKSGLVFDGNLIELDVTRVGYEMLLDGDY